MSKLYTGKKIAFMTTDRCNAHCKHCHLDYSGYFDSEELSAFVLCNNKTHIMKLNGAEVIMHSEYYPILKLCGQNFIKTNGIEIARNPEILSELKWYGINSITMSHHFAAHDLISTVPLSIVEKATKFILDAGMELWYMTVIDMDNYKDIPKMCSYAYDNGIRCIYFVNLLNTGEALNIKDKKILDDNQIDFVLREIQRMRQKYDKNILKISRSGTFGNVSGISRNFHCPAGNDLVAITPDGKVKPCVGMTGDEYTIGHVENNQVIIDSQLLHDGTRCLVHEIFNRGLKFEDLIVAR